MVLLRARGELALARGRHDEAWTWAGAALAKASESDAPKHVASARRLQGEILAARDRLDEAVTPLAAAVDLAGRLGTPRELWVASAALGRVSARLGRDRDAEAHYGRAVETLDAIARGLMTPELRQALLASAPVTEIYRALGRRPPPVAP
jgi:tetratricopeptide (TPR) repeat protein